MPGTPIATFAHPLLPAAEGVRDEYCDPLACSSSACRGSSSRTGPSRSAGGRSHPGQAHWTYRRRAWRAKLLAGFTDHQAAVHADQPPRLTQDHLDAALATSSPPPTPLSAPPPARRHRARDRPPARPRIKPARSSPGWLGGFLLNVKEAEIGAARFVDAHRLSPPAPAGAATPSRRTARRGSASGPAGRVENQVGEPEVHRLDLLDLLVRIVRDDPAAGRLSNGNSAARRSISRGSSTPTFDGGGKARRPRSGCLPARADGRYRRRPSSRSSSRSSMDGVLLVAPRPRQQRLAVQLRRLAAGADGAIATPPGELRAAGAAPAT